jgi:hypothetical protein
MKLSRQPDEAPCLIRWFSAWRLAPHTFIWAVLYQLPSVIHSDGERSRVTPQRNRRAQAL